MQHEFVFAGFGGQGIMFAGQLLAYAAMDAGYNVTWIPSYGPEMRGGTAYCYVILSEKLIGSPVVRHPEIALIFNIPSFGRFEPTVAPGGLLALNRSLIEHSSQRTDITQLAIPATESATALGNLKLANMVMLGAVLTARPVLPLEAIRKALAAHLPAHRRDTMDLNLQALDKGASLVPQRSPA